MPRQMVSAFPRPVQLAQAAAKRFELLLVGGLLPLGQFQRFQHFFHAPERSLKRLDDVVDLLDRLLNGGGCRGLPIAGSRWMNGRR